jgi:thermostable 8-oxoguanine DNA glycosylase
MELTVEEIASRVMGMDYDEAQKFLRSLNEGERANYDRYILGRFPKVMREEEKRCRAEHGCSLDDFYDIEHPSD